MDSPRSRSVSEATFDLLLPLEPLHVAGKVLLI